MCTATAMRLHLRDGQARDRSNIEGRLNVMRSASWPFQGVKLSPYACPHGPPVVSAHRHRGSHYLSSKRPPVSSETISVERLSEGHEHVPASCNAQSIPECECLQQVQLPSARCQPDILQFVEKCMHDNECLSLLQGEPSRPCGPPEADLCEPSTSGCVWTPAALQYSPLTLFTDTEKCSLLNATICCAEPMIGKLDCDLKTVR